MWKILVMAFVGYLAGSINMSLLITKYIGHIDLRTVGSGNVGGTNVARAMGWKWGALVIVLEILKSAAVGFFAKYIWPGDVLGLGTFEDVEVGADLVGMIVCLGVLLGNVFPCFNHFRGGKGVSVSGALLVVLDWRVFLCVFIVFVVVFLLKRIVSLGSICAAISSIFSVAFWYYGKPCYFWFVALITVMAATVVIRHRTNIKRLIKGTESQFVFRKK